MTQPLAVAAQERIVSTDAGLTSLIFALGGQQRLVGVDVTSQLPGPYGGLPRVGYHRALSSEGLLSLKPDLVLASEHAGPPEVFDNLGRFAIAVQRFAMPTNLDELQANVAALAAALTLEDPGAELQQSLQQRGVRLQAAALPNPRTVLLRESDGVLRVAGRDTAGQAMISLIGGQNAADYAGYRSFSQEALLALEPELLLIAAPVREGEVGASAEAWLQRYPLLRYSEAARRGRVSVVAAEALVGGLSLATLDQADLLLERLVSAQLAGP